VNAYVLLSSLLPLNSYESNGICRRLIEMGSSFLVTAQNSTWRMAPCMTNRSAGKSTLFSFLPVRHSREQGPLAWTLLIKNWPPSIFLCLPFFSWSSLPFSYLYVNNDLCHYSSLHCTKHCLNRTLTHARSSSSSSSPSRIFLRSLPTCGAR